MTRGDNHRQVLTQGVLTQTADQRHATFFGHAQIRDDQRDIGVASQMLQGKFD
ncbi:hypothetical protein D3C71_2227800 [compost metagenome]